jgi:hypothetical protein
MVSKVLPNSRHILHHRDAEAAELFGRPDTREHEELMALDPPVTLPLGTGISGAFAVALAMNCQLCLLVKREMG